MFLALVQGHLVATAKDPAMQGRKLLIVEPLKVDEAGGALVATGRAIVAIDTLGAGEGQTVLIVQGSSARLAEGCGKLPVDAVIAGIVDEAVIQGTKLPLQDRQPEA